jgi:tetratricopeptide (TPR) repeat protein
MSLPYAAGSLYSSVEDLYKWDRALKANKLLPEKYARIMFSPHEKGFGAHYAYGWIVGKRIFKGSPDSMYFTQHGGGINGFSSLITRYPENDQLVVLLNNFSGFPGAPITDEIIKILNGLEYEYPKQGIAYKVYEVINDEGIQSAIDAYKLIKEEESDAFSFAENELNNLGYYLMGQNRIDDAIEIFKLNIEEHPDKANPYDSMGEAYLRKGEKELAVKFYKKTLELNPGNTGAIEKLKALGGEVKLDEIKVSNEILSRYTGKYELAPNFIITITVEREQIFAQATGQQNFEIYPKSETEFYYKVVEAQIKFIVNDNGETESMILFQNGREMPAKKIQ